MNERRKTLNAQNFIPKASFSLLMIVMVVRMRNHDPKCPTCSTCPPLEAAPIPGFCCTLVLSWPGPWKRARIMYGV